MVAYNVLILTSNFKLIKTVKKGEPNLCYILVIGALITDYKIIAKVRFPFFCIIKAYFLKQT